MIKQGLQLKRRIGEGVIIYCGDDKIHIQLEKIYGSSVKIRINAPKNAKIWRDELPSAQE